MIKNLPQGKKIDTGIIICVIAVIVGLLPLFRPGFFPMHDDEQVGRLYDLDLAIKAGHIPPRIAPNLGFGYGYPFFNYYPSFVYYVAEIYKTLGFSYIDSIKLMIATGFILATVFMYLFSREYLSKSGAIIASIAYTYIPYHAVDVYVRGALPEFFSFAFVAGLFWALTRLQRKKRIRDIALFAVIGASLILTHNLIALMSGVFITVYFIFLLITTKAKKLFFLQSIGGGILALCLSAYFWLPSYAERNYTLIELLTKDLADYKQHFVYIRQFWDSPWGYGGSLYGLYDGLSFQIGKINIIGVVVATLLFVIYRKKYKSNVFLLFTFFFLLAAYLCTFHSQFIWDQIPQFTYIQFPWRFLLFTGFFSSFLLGAIFSISNFKYMPYAVVVCSLFILFFNKDFFVPREYIPVTDTDYTNQHTIRWTTSRMAAEYVPKGVATKKTNIGTSVVDINENEIAKTSFSIISGIATSVTVVQDKPQRKIFTLVANTPVNFQINQYSFPGWEVFVDDTKVSYNDNNKLKLIRITLESGQHTIKAIFKDTPIRVFGNIISLISILILTIYSIICVFYPIRNNRHLPHSRGTFGNNS